MIGDQHGFQEAAEGPISDIFEPISANTFVALPAASGPWHPEHCHGGAAAALLAHAASAAQSAVPMVLARLTVDLMRPVPVARPLTLTSMTRHQGRKMQLVEAAIEVDGMCLARASALSIRQLEERPLRATGPGPEVSDRMIMPGGFANEFVIVPVLGGLGIPGPADAWFRMTGTLVEGRHTSSFEQAVAVADFGSGIGHDIPLDEAAFPSLDLTVSFARAPVGPWTRLQSRWLHVANGRATCGSVLGDLHGSFGQAVQTILIDQ